MGLEFGTCQVSVHGKLLEARGKWNPEKEKFSGGVVVATVGDKMAVHYSAVTSALVDALKPLVGQNVVLVGELRFDNGMFGGKQTRPAEVAIAGAVHAYIPAADGKLQPLNGPGAPPAASTAAAARGASPFAKAA